MIIEQLRNLLIFGVILAVVVVLNMVYKSNKPICPLDFENQEEYLETVVNWIKSYYKSNPNASIEEATEARMKYLLKMGCVDINSEEPKIVNV